MVIVTAIFILGILKLFLYNKKSSKLFVIIAFALLFLIASLRSLIFGPDVMNYVNHYNKLKNESTISIWTNFINGTGKDPFFDLLLKFFSNIGFDNFIWLAILSFIFLFSISLLIYRYSSEFYISFITFISLGYFFFSMTGLRQTLAISIILMSYKYLREKKLMTFVLIVICASLFHSSALIFLIAYPLAFLKIGIKHLGALLIGLSIAVFFDDFLRIIIQNFGWNDSLASYAQREVTLNYSGFVIQLTIFLFCLFYKNKVLQGNKDDLSLYNIIFIGLIFQSFTIVVAEFFRLSLYFSIFNIILISKAIMIEEQKKLRSLIYIIILFSFFLYIFWDGTFFSYKFVWEDSI